MIRKHNEGGKHTYTLAMNEFGDLTLEEFHARYTGLKRPADNKKVPRNVAVNTGVIADSVDWTAKGAVTAVKDQGQCGSCWAFSSTGSIEGAWFIANGTLVSVSEQQLMDCSKPEGNQSCEGGWMDQAFQYVASNGGICAENAYPYTAQDHNSCQSCGSVAKISSFFDVGHTEDDLMAAVTQQPVSVAIEADQSAFQFYSSGVMTGDCGTQLDHGVLAVGYGELDGTQYWKVKNSWGQNWGMNGYILIQKGKAQSGGQCGILLAASYPVV